MARRPEDPRVTDLARYRRDRERARRQAPRSTSPAPQAAEPSLLGRRPHAGLFLILAIGIVAALAFLSGRGL